MPLSERIVVDPEVLAGKPVIRGTRLSVEFILEPLAAGQSDNELPTNYPGLIGVLKAADDRTNGVEPCGGNGLGALLAGGHESEGPERMAVTVGAMTGSLSAAAAGKRERAGKSVVRDMQAGQE
jgi:hypothetical protein